MMRKRVRGKSIVTQTVLRISGVSITALLVFTVVFTLFISTYMKDNILKSQQDQVDTATASLESRLEGLIGPMVALGEQTATYRLLTRYYEKYSADWMESIRSQDAYLQNVNLFTEYILDICLIRPDSECVYSMNDELRTEYAYLEQNWFTEAVERPGVIKYAPSHGTEHLYKMPLNHTFSVIYPVQRAGTLQGYVLMECDLEKIADFLGNSETQEADFLLWDAEGEMIYGESPKGQEPGKIAGENLDQLEPGKSMNVQQDGKLLIVHRLLANQWLVVLESDEDMILLPIRRVLQVVSVLGVIALLFLLGIMIYNTRKMEKPLHALMDRISSYEGKGAQQPEMNEDTPREIAVIRSKFEEMADKMNALIQDVYVAQLKEKEMELEALINQINPHFLYNVFQVIQTKAVLADNRDIEEMIQALSTMMRYTMERKRARVLVRDEVEYIEKYLMFYKARFMNLFTYELVYGPDVLEYKTVKFVLQPVVENCFKHAFKNRVTGGRIRILVTEEEEKIIFRVWDNGCGMDEKRLRQIEQKLGQDVQEEGIGIVNANARLQLVYGKDYGISVSSEAEQYTEVLIKIRKET